jgi:hypothetical protein
VCFSKLSHEAAWYAQDGEGQLNRRSKSTSSICTSPGVKGLAQWTAGCLMRGHAYHALALKDHSELFVMPLELLDVELTRFEIASRWRCLGRKRCIGRGREEEGRVDGLSQVIWVSQALIAREDTKRTLQNVQSFFLITRESSH